MFVQSCSFVGQKYPTHRICAAIVSGLEWYPQVPSCISFMMYEALSFVIHLSSGLLKPLVKSSPAISVAFFIHPFSWSVGICPFSSFVMKGSIQDPSVVTWRHSTCIWIDRVVRTYCRKDLYCPFFFVHASFDKTSTHALSLLGTCSILNSVSFSAKLVTRW